MNWNFPFWNGSKYPFTTLQQLNLDWLISTVKQISEEYPAIIDEINKKLNDKLNNAVNTGNSGDILVNIGNNESEWQNLAVEYANTIIEAVNTWLNNHPEATTTVQDYSLTLLKMTEQTTYTISRKESGTITPVYIGDYMVSENYLPSAVKYLNGKFYCINAPENDYAEENHSGLGKVSIFDIADNEKENEFTVLTGHGNSVAFDGTYFYVAPVWEYGAERTDTVKVYKYSSSFVLTEEITAPARIMGVTYDSVNSSLYALDYSGNIYKYEDGNFIIYSVIENWSDYYYGENIILEKYYNQDIAINNNEFYISSPFGNILHGKLSLAESYITDFMQMMRTDSTTRFIIGELEGMEFTNNHLYAVVYTLLPNNIKNAFVVELPVNHINATSPVMNGEFTVKDATLTLSEDTQNKFSLNTYEIRSILQLMCRTFSDQVSQIAIPTDNDIIENHEIFFPSKDITLSLGGTYTCEKLTVSGGQLNIFTEDEDNKLTFTATNNCIELRRSGALKISGNYPLIISVPNNTGATITLITLAYYMPTTIIRQEITNIENKPLYIGDSKIHPYEVYQGGTPTLFMPDTFTFHRMFGYISNLKKDIHITIHTPKAIRNNQCTMSGTLIIRGVNGYVNDAFDGIDTSSLIKEFIKQDDYTLEIVLKDENGAEFTNCENNTPIVIDGALTITW